MRKFILILALFLPLTLICSGCNNFGDEVNVTGEVSTSPVTERVLNTEPISTATVPNPNWGFPVHEVKVLDETVVRAELDKITSNLTLTSYNSGSTEVHVLDCFGHKAIVNARVAEDGSITFEAKPCEEEFINAAKYGILPGVSKDNLPDQSSKLQALIDRVWREGGGEIFIYPGFYNFSVIRMRDGITLKMYSGFTDAREGLTADLAEKINKGELTVLVVGNILNTNWNDFGRNGSSNFTVSGGVIDNDGKAKSRFYLGLCQGVTIENMILKDIKNGHFMQITGCRDVTVRNCIFAGYDWNGTFTAETVQIEQSHPGAHSGDYENAPIRFEQGEIFGCKNITIDSCYFGPSDELPGHHIAIGHHGTAHEAVADGLTITNNVFDNPTYAAIRFANIVDVEITGNKFISSADSNKLCRERDPGFILLYSNTNTVTYQNIIDGKTVTLGFSYELSGTHNVNISDNDFFVQKGSDKRIFTALGTGLVPGGKYEKSVLRQKTYDSKPYYVSGYFKSTNYFGNISFCGNNVTYDGQPTVSDYIFKLYSIYGYKFENNNVKLNDCTFNNTQNGVEGLLIQKCHLGEEAETYTFKSEFITNYILIKQPDGSEVRLVFTNQSTHKIIASEGGRIELSGDGKGNIIVELIPNEGYTFSAWQTADGVFNKTGYTKISESIELKAIFTGKE